jgi:ferredoxin-NADP reductase
MFQRFAPAAPLARLLAAPLWRSLLDEHVFHFYASRFDPLASLGRVLARVEASRVEAAGVRSIVLRPNRHWRGFRAGQHVRLTVEIAGVRHTRIYSPSNDPAAATVTLTVKRHPGGRVSGHLHDAVAVGDVVELGQAFGDVVLPEPVPPKLLMIAGGSGITPLMAMLRDLLARDVATDVAFAHYASQESELLFTEELRDLARRHRNLHLHLRTTRTSGRFSARHLDEIAPDAAERCTFVCGPGGLIASAHAIWRERGHPMAPRSEAVLPAAATPLTSATDVALHFVRSSRRARGRSGLALLPQAEAAGLQPASGCRMGICHSCTCRKRSGTVRNLLTGAVSSEPDEDIRLCISAPLSDVTLDL